MALNDWLQFTIGSPTIEIDNVSPIYEIGSLRMAGSDSLIMMVEDNYARGLTTGMMQELIRIDQWDGGGTYDAGFFFMASDDDLTSSGTCLTYSINSTDDISNTKVALQWHSNGIESAPVNLFTGPVFDREDSGGPLIIALELQWIYEPVMLNGLYIVMKEAHDPELTDFSNLTTVGRHIIFEEDPHFIGTSISEGIYMDSRGSGGDLDIKRDRTQLSELVIS